VSQKTFQFKLSDLLNEYMIMMM